jgi:hypothetical protein
MDASLSRPSSDVISWLPAVEIGRSNPENPNFQNSIQRQAKAPVLSFCSFEFAFLNLFRVSIFEFRVSASLASGSNAKPHSSITACHF